MRPEMIWISILGSRQKNIIRNECSSSKNVKMDSWNDMRKQYKKLVYYRQYISGLDGRKMKEKRFKCSDMS